MTFEIFSLNQSAKISRTVQPGHSHIPLKPLVLLLPETTTVLTMTRLFDIHGGALLGIGNDTASGEGEFLSDEVRDRMAYLGMRSLRNLKLAERRDSL